MWIKLHSKITILRDPRCRVAVQCHLVLPRSYSAVVVLRFRYHGANLQLYSNFVNKNYTIIFLSPDTLYRPGSGTDCVTVYGSIRGFWIFPARIALWGKKRKISGLRSASGFVKNGSSALTLPHLSFALMNQVHVVADKTAFKILIQTWTLIIFELFLYVAQGHLHKPNSTL